MTDNRKKVLLVNLQPLQRGGAQAVIMSIVRNLSNQFCFDILLFSDLNGWYDNEFLSYGGKIIRIPNYDGAIKLRQRADLYIRWMFNSRKVRKAISENGPYQAVHTIIAYEAGFVLKQAEKCGVPIRVAHTLVITKIPRNKIAMRLYAFFALKAMKRYSTHFVGCTEEACKTMFGDKENVLNGWKRSLIIKKLELSNNYSLKLPTPKTPNTIEIKPKNSKKYTYPHETANNLHR